MSRPRRISAMWVIGLLVVIDASDVSVARSTNAAGQVLHERLDWGDGDVASSPVFFFGDEGQPTGMPEAFSRGREVISRPPITAPLTAHRAPSGDKQGGAADSTEPPPSDPRGGLGSVARPDRDTRREGDIGYTTVFEPSIVPFKRDRVLDAVSANGDLYILSPDPVDVPLSDMTEVGGDALFWGAIDLIGREGVPIPIPSVAPQSRIVQYETTPSVPVQFQRDGADNLYATLTAPPPIAGQRIRLVWLSTAPERYFGAASVAGDDRVEPPKLSPLPPSLQADVNTFAKRAGFDPNELPDALIERLVLYFRAFTPGEPAQAKGSAYLDLALGKKGICRHRAYAFTISALGLGIQTRYVFNEAHVFVEVWTPKGGWLRVDLGGAADRLEIRSAASSTRHEPGYGDRFGWPPERAADGSAIAGATDVVGIPPTREQSREAGRADLSPRAPQARQAANLLPPPSATASLPNLMSTTTTLQLDRSGAFRGDEIIVSGTVLMQSLKPVESGFVQLLLLPEDGRVVLGILGIASLGSDGAYKQTLRIPQNQQAGRYEVVARFVGSSTLAPSLSP